MDPRLLCAASSTRVFLVVSALLGVLTALVVVVQAALLSDAISGVFAEGLTLAEIRPLALGLLGVVLVRGVLAWGGEVAAHRASATAKSQLRGSLLQHAVQLSAAGALPMSRAEVTTLAVRGIDALDAYFARYLPQLVLAAVVPLVVIVVTLGASPTAALIMVLTLPLIPVFMALVGWQTQRRTDRQWRTLARLSGHFLDVVAGLPTLKAFGRSKGQARAIREITAEYRRSSMAVLRVAFLSSLVLELLATLSVALVAVTVGFSLLAGGIELRTALFVLVIAPEVYLPWRLVGQHFHASTEGMTAARSVFDVLETPVPSRSRAPGTQPARQGQSGRTGPPGPPELRLDGVSVTYPDRPQAALDEVSVEFPSGRTTVVRGASGAGKSTMLRLLAGLRTPGSGRVLVDGQPLDDLDADTWRESVSWLPQQPTLFAATVRENIRLGLPSAGDEQVAAAADAAGLHAVLAALPDGIDTRLGDRGAGLSAGQRRRVALARVLLRDTPVVLLDEPTAGLDADTEAGLVEAIADVCRGRTAVIVSHREAPAGIADRAVDLADGRVVLGAGIAGGAG